MRNEDGGAVVEAMVREYLRSCLTVFDDDPVLRAKAFYEAGKWAGVLLVVVPRPGHAEVWLSECEQHVLELLLAADQPVPAEAIRDQMEARRIVWGLRTVKRALKQLMGLGLVDNRKRRPRGYYLIPRRMELFRRPAGAGTDNGTVLPNTKSNTEGGRESA